VGLQERAEQVEAAVQEATDKAASAERSHAAKLSELEAISLQRLEELETAQGALTELHRGQDVLQRERNAAEERALQAEAARGGAGAGILHPDTASQMSQLVADLVASGRAAEDRCEALQEQVLEGERWRKAYEALASQGDRLARLAQEGGQAKQESFELRAEVTRLMGDLAQGESEVEDARREDLVRFQAATTELQAARESAASLRREVARLREAGTSGEARIASREAAAAALERDAAGRAALVESLRHQLTRAHQAARHDTAQIESVLRRHETESEARRREAHAAGVRLEAFASQAAHCQGDVEKLEAINRALEAGSELVKERLAELNEAWGGLKVTL